MPMSRPSWLATGGFGEFDQFGPTDHTIPLSGHATLRGNSGHWGMSALPPKADIGTQERNVRFVPKADIGPWRAPMCRIGYPPAFSVSGVCFQRLPSTPASYPPSA